MAFVPLANRVLVEREEQSNTTASGIIEGDTVVFADFSGMEITIEGTKYLILLSKEILGLIK